MDAAEEQGAPVAKRFGDGLIGREHEFFDDLVRESMLGEVGPADAAVGVVFQHRFGHSQFECAAFEALFPQQ